MLPILLGQSLEEIFQKQSQVSRTQLARIVVWHELPLIRMKLSPERKLHSMFSSCWNEISVVKSSASFRVILEQLEVLQNLLFTGYVGER